MENKQTKNIIAFEGMPGAGKTTSIDFLRSRHNSNYFFLPQLLINDSIFETNDDFKIARAFIDAEVLKAKLLETLSNQCIFFLDRSYLSTIAFYYSKAFFLNSVKTHKVFEYVSSQFLQMIKNKEIIQPNKIIVLLVDTKESINRRKEFEKMQKYYPWFEEKFLLAMFDFYSNEKYKIFFEGKVNLMNTTSLSVSDVNKSIESFITIF